MIDIRRRTAHCLFQLKLCITNIAQASCLVFLKTAPQQALDCFGCAFRQPVPWGLALKNRYDSVRNRFARKCPAPGDQFEQQAAKRPYVTALIYEFSACLLWAHVPRSADNRSEMCGV